MTARVGVIGAGNMGTDHVAKLSTQVSGATVSFVADVDRERAEDAAAEAGARATGDPAELIASADVDAVLIASHDSTHAQLILDCFDAGKPVLCEKPLAPTIDECRRVVEADEKIVAETGRSLLSIGFMRRFDPGYVELKRAILDRRVGEPLMMHCISRNSMSAPGATSESAVTNSAIHELDAIPWLLDSPITEVSWHSGRSSGATPEGLADPQLMLFRTADGTLSTLELFLNAQYGYSTRCEVVGERGTVSLVEPVAISTNVDRVQGTSYAYDWRARFADAYRVELQTWISSLSAGAGRDPGVWLPTGRDGLQASIIAEAVITSMHNGGAWTPVGK